jgi:hypothetical protein
MQPLGQLAENAGHTEQNPQRKEQHDDVVGCQVPHADLLKPFDRVSGPPARAVVGWWDPNAEHPACAGFTGIGLEGEASNSVTPSDRRRRPAHSHLFSDRWKIRVAALRTQTSLLMMVPFSAAEVFPGIWTVSSTMMLPTRRLSFTSPRSD